ncbi:MAG: PKD domain-containing protein [Saprospiraceae bacterium]|nr:PKD domain-containing protein [Saprospiraceae bacterium]
MKNLIKSSLMLLLAANVFLLTACVEEDDNPTVTVISDFTYELDENDKLTVYFTNKSVDYQTISWDFGDGSPKSSEKNPTHLYARGDYEVVLTAVGADGKTVVQREIVSAVGPFGEDKIVGAKPWKVRGTPNSVFVGPGLGSADWWSVPAEGLSGAWAGTPDDWSCMTKNEFYFTASSTPNKGTMEYKSNGFTRNDGYFGGTNGCISDADVAASGNGAAFGPGTHSYELIPNTVSPSGRWVIKLTNGSPDRAAFLGFYKGYHGGENGNSGNPANGGKETNQYEVMSYEKVNGVETMVVSVDITSDLSGGAAWTTVLVRE